MTNEKLKIMDVYFSDNIISLFTKLLSFLFPHLLHYLKFFIFIPFFININCLSSENSQLPQFSILLDSYKYLLNGQANTSTEMKTIGGLVGGLTSGTLSLQNNLGDTINLTTNGSFTFPTALTSNSSYSVTVSSQPAGLICTVYSGTGTATANVNNIVVSCNVPGGSTYTIGGAVSGLSGTVVLRNNGGDDKSISANGAYTFSTSVANLYSVTVLTQPTGQTCTISNSSGTASANVTNANVSCATSTYKIGGTVGGLSGGILVVQNNGGDNKSLTANGIFEFNTSISHGGAYSVTVLTNPTNQFCSVANGTGTATDTVTTIIVDCNNLPGTTVQSFTDLGNQTIQDNNTGLIWMKCSMSEVSGVPLAGNCSFVADSGSVAVDEVGSFQFCSTTNHNCNGGVNTLNLQPSPSWLSGSTSSLWTTCNDANSIPTGGFAGKTNWRVPTKDELVSLLDYSKTSSPVINTTYFPNTVAGSDWSSTISARDNNLAFDMSFNTGSVIPSSKTSTYYVRCISGP